MSEQKGKNDKFTETSREQALAMLQNGVITPDEFPIHAHWFLMAKGGCLKTTSSSYMYQYLFEAYQGDAIGVDIDQSNSSFYQYSLKKYQNDLRITSVDLSDGEGGVDRRKLDTLPVYIENATCPIVFDNGSNAYKDLTQYLVSSNIFEAYADRNYRHTIHMPVIGSESFGHCINGIEHLVELFGNVECVEFVVWLHKNHGHLEEGGKGIHQLKQFQDYEKKYKDRFRFVDMPKFDPQLTNLDVMFALKHNLTFKTTQIVDLVEADENNPFKRKVSPFGLESAQRSRLARAQRDIFTAIARAGL